MAAPSTPPLLPPPPPSASYPSIIIISRDNARLFEVSSLLAAASSQTTSNDYGSRVRYRDSRPTEASRSWYTIDDGSQSLTFQEPDSSNGERRTSSSLVTPERLSRHSIVHTDSGLRFPVGTVGTRRVDHRAEYERPIEFPPVYTTR